MAVGDKRLIQDSDDAKFNDDVKCNDDVTCLGDVTCPVSETELCQRLKTHKRSRWQLI